MVMPDGGRTLRSRGRLQGGEKRWYALHLVQDHVLRQIGNEANWVGLGRRSGHVVIEVDVCVAHGLAHHAGESRLATLARAVDQHHRRIDQRLDQAGST